MKIKFCVLLCLTALSPSLWADVLSQAEYDQKIQHYTSIIKQTKNVLDRSELQDDVKQQNLAFCERLNAYQNIYQLSEQNPHLERTELMKTVAKMYLDRQMQSLTSSGMTEKVFCASHKASVEEH